jgi:hypothetical protein
MRRAWLNVFILSVIAGVAWLVIVSRAVEVLR